MDEKNNIPNLEKDEKGISNSTVVVLIILALLVTTIGTWAVLNSAQERTEESGTNVGQVSLTIVAPEQLNPNVQETPLN